MAFYPDHRHAILLAGLLLAGAARAQCGVWDNRLNNTVGLSNTLTPALTTWDPDGTGPRRAELVVARDYAPAGVVRRNGAIWERLGTGAGLPDVLCAWDPDASGPESPLLIAGGARVNSDASSWDGVRWNAMLSPEGTRFVAMANWDHDNDSRTTDVLVGVGSIFGGIRYPSFVATWNGISWQRLGPALDGDGILCVATWSSEFGAPPELIVGGKLYADERRPEAYVARWSGSTWAPLSVGVNNRVRALAAWDPDGAGPASQVLVAGGDMGVAGWIQVDRIAQFDGSVWNSLPGTGVTGVGAAVHAIHVHRSGEGPEAPDLVVGGVFAAAGGVPANNVAMWRHGWHALAAGLSDRVTRLTTWDHDDDDQTPPRLVAGGAFLRTGDTYVNTIAQWDGESWLPFGEPAMDGITSPSQVSIAIWDADGPGLTPATPIVSGIDNASGRQVNGVTRWSGETWETLGFGVAGSSLASTTWDPDGDGPELSRYILGGNLTAAGGAPVNRIASWNGQDWSALGSGVDGVVRGLSTWDPDGAGPMSDLLVVIGQFRVAGGVDVNRIATWDGQVWRALGSGVGPDGYVAYAWDRDGDGPQAAELYAGGAFRTIAGVPVNFIARWNGTSWLSLAGGVDSAVRALRSWDPDGPGPTPSRLVVAGDFLNAGGTPARRIAVWDGNAWSALGGGMSGSVRILEGWKPEGSDTEFIVAGGGFSLADGSNVSGATYWDGVRWQPFQSGFDNSVHDIQSWSFESGGRTRKALIFGGTFSRAVDAPPGQRLIMWMSTGIEFRRQPESGTFVEGETVVLSSIVHSADPVTCQWRRNGENLADGSTGHGSTISGATTGRLAISGATRMDQGVYTLVASDHCGNAVSEGAVITVLSSCPADFNADGFLDFFDYADFVACFEGSGCADPLAADFNEDGFVDFFDYADFVAAFETGC